MIIQGYVGEVNKGGGGGGWGWKGVRSSIFDPHRDDFGQLWCFFFLILAYFSQNGNKFCKINLNFLILRKSCCCFFVI